ncbi:MAG: sensor histidine kinase [Myxococcota bacterium]|nr:sensor histidine kinase [Myxococcota bacterium]
MTSRAQAVRRTSLLVSGLMTLVGALVLVAWWLQIEGLTRLHPSLASMKANTAVMLAGLGAMGLLADHPRTRRLSVAVGIAVALIAAGTSAEWLLDLDLGLDQLLAADPYTQGAPPGRPSPATAWLFWLLATARLLQGLPVRGFRLGDVLAGTAGGLSLLALSGYATSPTALYALGPFQSMALHTTAGFLLGTLAYFSAKPDQGVMRLLLSDTQSADFLRGTLLAAAVLLPAARVVTGALEGQGWISPGLSDAVFMTVLALTLVLVLLRGARRLAADERRRQQAEAAQAQAIAELADLNAELEARVLQRTESLQRSVHERDVLIREVHHRVKNNLAVVASLLRLQAAQVQDPAAKAALAASQQRIQSISEIHQLLYSSKDHGAIPMDRFAQGLCDRVMAGMGHANVGLHLELNHVPMSLVQAVPCALILNELITNALKHAFPDGREGRVEVDLGVQDGWVHLRVRDDGVGAPETTSPKRGKGLGTSLVENLTAQLRGELESSGGPGTCVSLRFPLDLPERDGESHSGAP